MAPRNIEQLVRGSTTRSITRRELLKHAGLLGIIGVPLLTAACGSSAGGAAQPSATAVSPNPAPTPTPPPPPTMVMPPVTSAATTAAATPATSTISTGAVKMQLDLVILTGGMIGKKGWPAYIPSQLIAPANSTVSVQIVNFDDGTAPLVADSIKYATVTGVVGNQATAATLTPSSPNTPGPASTFSKLDPKDVAHTFTIADLQLNVPIPVTSIVTFAIQTGKPGDHKWKCESPCGSGSDGMAGAMQSDAYMEGVLHVV